MPGTWVWTNEDPTFRKRENSLVENLTWTFTDNYCVVQLKDRRGTILRPTQMGTFTLDRTVRTIQINWSEPREYTEEFSYELYWSFSIDTWHLVLSKDGEKQYHLEKPQQ